MIIHPILTGLDVENGHAALVPLVKQAALG
jgi:hypothetical protein